jgi:two-component system chemotaxis response regulator CheY
MLTTESQASKKQEGKAAGATGWIVKPFNPQQLLGVVAKVVR